MEDHEIRAALDHHWAASDANDFEGEHQIYREDAVLEYPQSGERVRGSYGDSALNLFAGSIKCTVTAMDCPVRMDGHGWVVVDKGLFVFFGRQGEGAPRGRSFHRKNTS